MKPKKKPSKKTRTPHEIEMSRLMREARASCSLDGETQFCLGCEREADNFKHTCGLRPMTAAEREVVEAAMLFVTRHTDGAHCSFELDPHNCGSTEQLINACRALRAAKEGK